MTALYAALGEQRPAAPGFATAKRIGPRSPIGRDDGLKIHAVWVRIPPGAPASRSPVTASTGGKRHRRAVAFLQVGSWIETTCTNGGAARGARRVGWVGRSSGGLTGAARGGAARGGAARG